MQNLTLQCHLCINAIEDGLKKLEGRMGQLEAIHICIDHLDIKAYPPKKKYFEIMRIAALSKLDRWIYNNLVVDEEYAKYLEKYRIRQRRFPHDNIDEYILKKHYRPRAIRILRRTRRKFNLKEWTQPRYCYQFTRNTNLQLKDGTQFHFDFRSPLATLFIIKDDKKREKQILGVGGSGSSVHRLHYTLFTALFYLLGKKRKIAHHLLRYDGLNNFHYISTYDKPIVTWDLGSNYHLNNELRNEIMENGTKLQFMIKKSNL